MIEVLLFSLALILTGCSRRNLLDDYPVSGVDIVANWEGVSGGLPEGLRVLFYPKDGKGVKVDTYLPIRGGQVKVPPGRYSVVIYNYNTETVRIRGEESYETIEAYTGHCTGLGIPDTESLVWSPDPLYVVKIDDLHVVNSEEVLRLDVRPKLVVTTYFFEIQVDGLEYVSSVFGYAEGMAESYFLGKGTGKNNATPIYFEGVKKGNRLAGRFTAFGLPEGALSRATFSNIKMVLAFVKTDNKVQEVEIDITEMVKEPQGGGEGGEGGGEGGEGGDNPPPVEPPTEIELPIEDLIEVEKPDTPPSGDGGFGGEVEGWGNETEVELPVS